MVYNIEPMKLEDIPEVSEIERMSFGLSWSAYAYHRELTNNRLAQYIVARWHDQASPSAVHRHREDDPSIVSDDTPPNLKNKISQFWRSWRQTKSPGSAQQPISLGGYAGLWLMVDEAHITTIAVRPNLRRKGLGEALMIALAEASAKAGAAKMTLEVRVSNYDAQNMYHKFTFKEEGVRRRYYSDNNEDALIMWSEALESDEFQQRLASIKDELQQRLAANPLPPPWETTT